MDIDTSDIRAGYVRSEILAPYWSDERALEAKKARTEFDQWLAEHDRQMKAEAWDEGHRTGWEHCQDGNYGTDHWDDDTPNPYGGQQ